MNVRPQWICAVTVALGLPSLADAQQYHLTDLGVAPTFSYSYGFSLNEQGQSVGFSWGQGSQQDPSMYTDGPGMQSLTRFGSDYLGAAYEINNVGQAVGYDYYTFGSASRARALFWSGGSVTDIGAVSGTVNAYAYGVNDSGMVVGEDDSATGSSAFSWTQGGGIVALSPLSGQANAWASEVDSNGVIVGASGNLGTRWVNGVAAPISSSESLGPAGAINGAGDVMGSNGSSVYLWKPGHSSVTLGLLSGFATATVGGFNDADVLVGAAFNSPNDSAPDWRAWIWDSQHGTRDLNSLVDSSGAGWTLFQAGDINNKGQITGTGLFNNGTSEHAYRLEPVPEPLGVLAVALGCLAMGCRRRVARRR